MVFETLGVPSISSALKAANDDSVRHCLGRCTYIWEKDGDSYWAYITDVDYNSVSGCRCMDENWVNFDIDIRRIDTFICY